MIKGWIDRATFRRVLPHEPNAVHVQAVPPNAIEGEAVVKSVYLGDYDNRTGMLPLPAALIGKRVRYCIWIEEGE